MNGVVSETQRMVYESVSFQAFPFRQEKAKMAYFTCSERCSGYIDIKGVNSDHTAVSITVTCILSM